MIGKGTVKFHLIEQFEFLGRKRLKEEIISLMEEEGVAFESLDYIFCSDEYLLDINQRFLQHDDLTDIITFNLADQEGAPSKVAANPVIGEIYISVERVRDNALLFNVDFDEELRRVIFHGALHLCGYMDKSKKDQQVMRDRENYYLGRST